MQIRRYLPHSPCILRRRSLTTADECIAPSASLVPRLPEYAFHFPRYAFAFANMYFVFQMCVFFFTSYTLETSQTRSKRPKPSGGLRCQAFRSRVLWPCTSYSSIAKGILFGMPRSECISDCLFDGLLESRPRMALRMPPRLRLLECNSQSATHSLHLSNARDMPYDTLQEYSCHLSDMHDTWRMHNVHTVPQHLLDIPHPAPANASHPPSNVNQG